MEAGFATEFNYERNPMNNHSDEHNHIDKETVASVFSRNPEERKLLQQKHLMIVGAGSIGSAIAVMAARAGVDTFTIVDNDNITPENIGRHVCDLTFEGHGKADAVAELIKRINPEARVLAIVDDFRESVADLHLALFYKDSL